MFEIGMLSDSVKVDTQQTKTFDAKSLVNDLKAPDHNSIFNYNSGANHTSTAVTILSAKRAENIFFNSVNKINFGEVKMNSFTSEMLDSIKDVKDSLNESYAKVAAPLDAEEPTYEAMLQKQMDVSIASLEIELASKITGKSIENLYMLLRQ